MAERRKYPVEESIEDPVPVIYQSGYLTIKAVKQIRQRGYADGFKGDARPVRLVGMSFSSEERNIVGWKVED